MRKAVNSLGLLIATILLIGAVCSPLLSLRVGAAQLTNRNLIMGNYTAGATTDHTIGFSYTTHSAIGSVMFEYCTSPLDTVPCTEPTGVNLSNVTLTSQDGETGYFILVKQTNRIILTRAALIVPTTPRSVYSFSGATNPTGVGTFFVRVSTYGTVDATGPYTDYGALAQSTVQGMAVSTEVPPILKFCAGLAVALDCTTTGGNIVDLGILSSSASRSGKSQMVAGTNAEMGLAITVNGTTMTSGINEIPAPDIPTVSAPGNGQFGINLRANADPSVGEDPSGVGVSIPAASYNIPNRFMFKNGDIIATSPVATELRKFTVSYVANVPPTQPPGVYSATLTYVCTATF